MSDGDQCKVPGCPRARRPYKGFGRPSVYCDQHDPKPKRTKRRKAQKADQAAAEARARVLGEVDDKSAKPQHKTEAELEHDAARNEVRRRASVSMGRALDAWRPQMLAVYLDEHTAPKRAAALAGIAWDTDEELAELAEQARAYKGITEGRPQAVAAELTKGATMAILIWCATLHAVPPAQMATAIHRLIDARERLVGRAGESYTELISVLQLPDGMRWDPNTLLPSVLLTTPTPTRPEKTTPPEPGSSSSPGVH